jgi:hypothetical protein
MQTLTVLCIKLNRLSDLKFKKQITLSFKEGNLIVISDLKLKTVFQNCEGAEIKTNPGWLIQ